MDAIWTELELAPTDDAIAIKRAYAKKLKTNRPDDDAAAYQRLREAYDLALDWARLQRALTLSPDDGTHRAADNARAEHASGDTAAVPRADEALDRRSDSKDMPAPSDVGFCASRQDPRSGDAAPQPVAESDVDGATFQDCIAATDDGFGTGPIPHARTDRLDDVDTEFDAPFDIAQRVYDFWKKHGNAPLVERWPYVRDDLDRLPFALRADASATMANLVLQHPGMPRAFVEALAAHFQWGLDFRSTQDLGAARSHALSQHLRDLGVLRINDPSVLRRYANLRRIAALRKAGRHRAARLLSLLLPGRTLEQWLDLPERIRAGLGIDAWTADDIHRWLLGATILRTLAFAAILAALTAQLPGENGVRAMVYGVIGAMATRLAWGIAQGMRFLFDGWYRHAAVRARWLDGRPGTVRLVGGIVLALAGAAVPLVSVTGGWRAMLDVAWWLSSALAPMLAWSHALRWRAMLLPVALALHVCLDALLSPAIPDRTIFSLALAWTLSAHWALLRWPDSLFAIYRNPFVALRPANAWGWVVWVVFFKGIAALAAAIVVLSLPATLLVQSIGYGQRFAFTSIALGMGIALVLSNGRGLVDGWPALGLLVAVIALASLQWGANRAGDSGFFQR